MEINNPYEVPENWAWVPIKNILEKSTTRDPSKFSSEVFHYVDIDSIDNTRQMIKEPKIIDTTKAPSRAKKALNKNDVIISLVRPYLKNIALIEEEDPLLVGSTAFYVCVPQPNLDSKYLYELLRSPYVTEYLIDHTKGDNAPSVRNSDFEKMPIPIPNLQEQQRISKRIERLFNKVDEALLFIKDVKDSFEIRKTAILQKAIKGQLGTNVPDEEKPTQDIQMDQQPYKVPENWVWVSAEHAAKWGSGGTPSRNKEEYYGGEIPWIKTGELNDGMVADSEETITEKGLQESSAKLFPKDSIAIAMYGATIGKLGILGMDAATNQACAVGQAYDFLNVKYMFYYFLARRNDLIALGKGGAQPNISQTIIKQFPIAIPPLKEQLRIVEKTDQLLSHLENENQFVLETEKELLTLKQTILNKAFRGEL
jgi:type I restriction enzyme, S subunit